MTWQEYQNNFKNKAKQKGLDDDEISVCLTYAKRLFDQGLPIIFDQQHLSLLVGYKYSFLLNVSNASNKFYRIFEISKKNNGTRAISEPLPSLKEIQRWILDHILNHVPVVDTAKAYVKNRSIKDNAKFHRKQPIVLSLDIKDFFDCLKIKPIIQLFSRLGYSQGVSVMLAKLCTLHNQLPQGAPTSAALSNLLMANIDRRIFGYARKYKLRYTRYADDLTLSGEVNVKEVIDFVRVVLNEENLELNYQKTRSRNRGQRQEVTGIVVNEKLQTSQRFRRNIRQSVYYINKFGLSSHLEHIGETRANYIYHLFGQINHALFVNPKDTEMLEYRRILKQYLPDKRTSNSSAID